MSNIYFCNTIRQKADQIPTEFEENNGLIFITDEKSDIKACMILSIPQNILRK
jgi:hypothetical protein